MSYKARNIKKRAVSRFNSYRDSSLQVSRSFVVIFLCHALFPVPVRHDCPSADLYPDISFHCTYAFLQTWYPSFVFMYSVLPAILNSNYPNIVINLDKIILGDAMKNFLKGTGAAIGYIVLYFVINILVIFTGSIYLGIKEGIKAINEPGLSASLPQIIESIIDDNAMLFNIIAAVICLFVFWMIILNSKKTVKERLDLNPISFKNTWPVLILGVTTNIFISHFIGFLPIPEPLIQEYSEATNLIGDEITLVQILSVVLAAPVLEEILYRGLIMKSLQRGMPVFIALIIQAVLFGLMHGQLIWVFYATFLGVLLAVIKLKYKSLYPCILMHLSFNAANYVLIPLYSIMPDNIYSDILLFIIAFIISVFMVRIIFRKEIDKPSSCITEPGNTSQDADGETIEVYFEK